MPPKQKRPRVLGEGSSAPKKPRIRKDNPPTRDPPIEKPVAQDPPFSSDRFVSESAEQNFREGFAKRTVLCERGIILESFEEPPCDLAPLIFAKGWQHWVKFQHRAVVPLVREFYSNVTANRDTSGNRCLTTQVRKREIELRPSDIAEIFQIPREEPRRALAESEVDLKKESLAKLLTGREDAVWLGPRLSKKNLSQKCNILHRLLCSHLMPHAFTGAISLAQATFLGKMLLGVHIDLAKHIFDTIDSVAKSPTGGGGLPFGGFITYYLLLKGVKEKAKHEVIQPMERISQASTRRSEGQLKRLETPTKGEGLTQERGEPSGVPGQEEERPVHEPQPQDPQPQRPPEEYTLQGLYEMVRNMQQRQEAMFEELKERQRAIYSGFMKMYGHYRELDAKVDLLLKDNGEESSSSSQEASPSGDKREDSVETCIQKTIAMAREEDALRANPPTQQPSSMPTSSEPTASPTAAADPTRKTTSGDSTEEYSSSEDSPRGDQ